MRSSWIRINLDKSYSKGKGTSLDTDIDVLWGIISNYETFLWKGQNLLLTVSGICHRLQSCDQFNGPFNKMLHFTAVTKHKFVGSLCRNLMGGIMLTALCM